MDLDVMIMKFKELQDKVEEIREKLGLSHPHPPPLSPTPPADVESEPNSAEEVGEDEEEVEEHDPELGPVKRKRKRR